MEQREIDNRKLNIMCFGLSERTEENAELRNAEELTKAKHIINNIPEIPEEDFPLDEAPVCVGKFQENKIRPLKFKARPFESKKHLLQTSRTKLKDRHNGEYKDLFFKADLTKNQRAEAFARREIRRKANMANLSKKDEPSSGGGGASFQGSKA